MTHPDTVWIGHQDPGQNKGELLGVRTDADIFQMQYAITAFTGVSIKPGSGRPTLRTTNLFAR